MPALLFAMTVSPQAALYVTLCYVAYHVIENYLIIPKIYGDRLKLSTVAVILGLLAGTAIDGVAGAGGVHVPAEAGAD